MFIKIHYYTFIYVFVLLFNNLYGCCCFKKGYDPQVVFPTINIYDCAICDNSKEKSKNINTNVYNQLKPSSRVKIINIINEYQNNKHFAYFLECFKNGMYEDAKQMLNVMLASNIEYEDYTAFFVVDVFNELCEKIYASEIKSSSLNSIFIREDMYTDINALKQKYQSTSTEDNINKIKDILSNEFRHIFDVVNRDMCNFVLRIFKSVAMDQAQKQKLLLANTIAEFIIQKGIDDSDIKMLHTNLTNNVGNKATNNIS